MPSAARLWLARHLPVETNYEYDVSDRLGWKNAEFIDPRRYAQLVVEHDRC